MTQEKNRYKYNMKHHQKDSLFREWPTPSDTVAGFGGNRDSVADRQWQSKKD